MTEQRSHGEHAGANERLTTHKAMDATMQPSSQLFIKEVMTNPVNAELLRRLPCLGLSECFLTAGCLFQATWNRISGHPAGWGVKDYDVFYFDGNNLSWEAEDSVIRRARTLLADLRVNVEVKNQARVHLWYQQRFNAFYPQLTSSRGGIDRYLIACTCVGIEVATGALYAPNGLQEVYEGILRMNPVNSQPIQFRQKAEDYKLRWPWLRILAK
jgi:hypothetical protein